MPDSPSPANPSTPRMTLKLKGAPRQAPVERPAVKAPAPQGKSNGNADARWSDDYKRQMQADMDRLGR